METAQKTIVVALGGNALQRNGEASVKAQQEVAKETAKQLAILVKAGYKLVIVHGNGPQVGDILLHEEAKGLSLPPESPLDTCVSMSQGEIGYWLQQALQNELAAQGIEKNVATIITQVVVDKDDSAFQNPSKPIGPFYPDQSTAEAAAQERGFMVKEDAGRGWRRVVPSPMPLDIVEKGLIRDVLSADSIVIAAGGGGVPVVRRDNQLAGVEAVIDKDHSAAKLAELIEADILMILMDLDQASINFRQPDETPLDAITTQELQRYIDAGQFAPGSMLPKIQAAVAFAQIKPGNRAIITSAGKALAAIDGQAGTRVTA
ncbi:MAG TPA: carbamate kinase [Patescibacteria group bacterium]|nr:carbamate kinase [Patescibacteria group bacterium]